MDSTERFTVTVADYARYRPDYPDAAVQWLLDQVAPNPRVADLGCGTGLLSRGFLARGLPVVGVEPNGAMLQEAVRQARAQGARVVADTPEPATPKVAAQAGALPGTFQPVEAPAEAIPLPDDSVDLVICGQALHWFDLPQVLAEIGRIVAPGGVATAVWNVRASSPFLDAYDAVLRHHCAEYHSSPGSAGRVDAVKAQLPACREARFPHHQELDLGGLIGRAWSSSYVAHGVTDRAAFNQALTDLFVAHGRGGAVRIDYITRCLAWPAQAPESPPPSMHSA